jgi:hypothetical protein
METPIGDLGPSQSARIKTQLWEIVHPAGSESCTKTEGHPLLTHGSAAFETKRTVSKNSKMFSCSKLDCNNHSEKQLFFVFVVLTEN